ncbi:uncharacterized protein LOC127801717 isoform X2 [Diospyros lotus]|uniref:uncharacterized protein LOC127801717 isoform X2 n=1 Tax=Diospyros lotus TaxID=55363 RepID=UPI00225ACF0B|nr:uncharacterized protein LOC127801717 isoform X2 [Diospyros lotus]
MGKTSSRSEPSTRADRKFEKKLQFYAKVRDTVASLGVQKAISKNKKDRSRKKKLEAYDFSSLSEFLPDLKVSKQVAPTKFKLNSKSRQTLMQFLTILLSCRTRWLPFINTCTAPNLAQTRSQKESTLKVGRSSSSRRRILKPPNLWRSDSRYRGFY